MLVRLGLVTSRARTVFAVLAACASMLSLNGGVASAEPPTTAAEAQQRVDDARSAANDAAARLSDATTKYEQLGDQVAAVERDIARGRKRAAKLRDVVRRRAVTAYTGQGGDSDAIAVLLSSDDFLTALRRVNLLETVNGQDNDAIDELAALERDLADQKAKLDARREEQAAALKTLEQDNKDVQARLADAETAQHELETRFAAEAAAEALRRAASRAPSGAPGQIIVNPGGGPFQCPVAGATAFSDDFGAPRTGHVHGGIDMFAAEGTPLVAVAAGSYSQGYDPAGGNDAYVNANGNTYFYAHLSGYAGGARNVQQGEVIGYVGHTGDAQGSHLHFEIRLGGANGQRINPYPTLRQYC